MHLKRLLVIGVLMLSPSLAQAWWGQSHAVIAQIAYDNLNPEAKERVNVLSARMFNQLPVFQQLELTRTYKDASTFAKLASLADYWPQWRLGRVFKVFHANLPDNLIPYAQRNTKDWHFINQPYPATSGCQIANPFNIVWAIEQMSQDLRKNYSDSNAQALLMVFQEHFIGDLHQPLHSITAVDENCKPDFGGNLFCLYRDRKNHCKKSLHVLWDNAVDAFKSQANIRQIAQQLQQLYPKQNFNSRLQDKNPLDWAKENEQYGAFIYSATPNQFPSASYYQQGQAIAKSQIALAGYRLADELNAVLKTDQTQSYYWYYWSLGHALEY